MKFKATVTLEVNEPHYNGGLGVFSWEIKAALRSALAETERDDISLANFSDLRVTEIED